MLSPIDQQRFVKFVRLVFFHDLAMGDQNDSDRYKAAITAAVQQQHVCDRCQGVFAGPGESVFHWTYCLSCHWKLYNYEFLAEDKGKDLKTIHSKDKKTFKLSPG